LVITFSKTFIQPRDYYDYSGLNVKDLKPEKHLSADERRYTPIRTKIRIRKYWFTPKDLLLIRFSRRASAFIGGYQLKAFDLKSRVGGALRTVRLDLLLFSGNLWGQIRNSAHADRDSDVIPIASRSAVIH
jgi:hypothetical protein